jgi:hypothetical protein
MRLRGLRRAGIVAILGGAAACSYDWDSLDPRIGSAAGGSPGGGYTSSGTAGQDEAGTAGLAGGGAGGTVGPGGEGGISAGSGGSDAGSGGTAGAGTGGSTPGGGSTGGAGGGSGGTTCPQTLCGTDCVDIRTSNTHCGGCSRSCDDGQVATMSCMLGLCQSSCESGFGNCSRPTAPDPDDGCETDLLASLDHCGGCDRSCDATRVDSLRCTDGACDSTCAAGFANCSIPDAPDPDDGCETQLGTVDDCSTCGDACADDEVCLAGSCTVPCSAAGQPALLVVLQSPAAGSDSVVQGWLETDLGFAVTVLDDVTATTASADGMDLVVLSTTARTGAVGTKYTDVSVGVVTWKSASDFGSVGAVQTLEIVAPAHPIAAGLVGPVEVYTGGLEVSWGVPATSATTVATVPGGTGSRAGVFAYEVDAARIDATLAPARRVGLFLSTTGVSAVTVNGKRLALTSFCWAAGLLP